MIRAVAKIRIECEYEFAPAAIKGELERLTESKIGDVMKRANVGILLREHVDQITRCIGASVVDNNDLPTVGGFKSRHVSAKTLQILHNNGCLVISWDNQRNHRSGDGQQSRIRLCRGEMFNALRINLFYVQYLLQPGGRISLLVI